MANERMTLSMLSNQMRMGSSRATVREFDDDHLMQQIKFADVYHSETPSDFERWQMVGVTATPLKQDEDEQQQKSKQGQGSEEQGDWNHDQPKGPAAEAVMLYVGGQRSHPIGMVDDRRVRPYKVPAGASAFYAASGTGQMMYHNDDGSSLVTTNNPKYGKNEQQKERYASIRHVDKKPQDRNKSSGNGSAGDGGGSGSTGGSGSGSQSQDYKHEGETINMEVRVTKSRIEFRDGDNVVGYYDKQNKRWSFTGEMRLGSDDATDPAYGVNKDSGKGQVTESTGNGAVLIKTTKPGPPTSGDINP